jgi:hypothetical protein
MVSCGVLNEREEMEQASEVVNGKIGQDASGKIA